MDAEKVLPIALGAGVVIAVIVARNGGGSGGAPTVVNLSSGEPDPSVEAAIRSRGEVDAAKVSAIGSVASGMVDLFGQENAARAQLGTARYAAYRDVATEQISSGNALRTAIATGAINAERDATIAGVSATESLGLGRYGYHESVDTTELNAKRDVEQSRIGASRDVAIAKQDTARAQINADADVHLAQEQTRQEKIRSDAQVRSYDIQGRTQSDITRQEERGDTTRAIIGTGGAIVGGILGSVFGPAGSTAGAGIGGWIGEKLGSLF